MTAPPLVTPVLAFDGIGPCGIADSMCSALFTHVCCRLVFSVYANLIPEFISSDALAYKNILRMDNDSFALLLEKVQSRITHQNTVIRQGIGSAECLAVTL